MTVQILTHTTPSGKTLEYAVEDHSGKLTLTACHNGKSATFRSYAALAPFWEGLTDYLDRTYPAPAGYTLPAMIGYAAANSLIGQGA